MTMAPLSGPNDAPFNGRTIFWGLLASLLAAAGFVLLSTYAPEFQLGPDRGSSAVSKGGTGFAGLVELMTLAGDEPVMARSFDDLETDGLVVVTIAPNSDPDLLEDIIGARSDLDTLFVLPKWQTVADPAREGWVRTTGRLAAFEVDRWLAQFLEVKSGRERVEVRRLVVPEGFVAPLSPPDLQWADQSDALISAGNNRAVLIALQDKPFYVLTDPDLLNNAALKDAGQAAAAIGLIQMLQWNEDRVVFDLTLHGANRKHDLAKLLLEPPFLALTLSVLAAAALAVFHGLGRFGPPQAETRAIPFGKRALVETTARLMRRAGRLDNLGRRYAAVMRRRAAALLGAPQGLRDDALDHWLEARDKTRGRGSGDDYPTLSGATRNARNEAELTLAARRLNQWIARRFRERR